MVDPRRRRLVVTVLGGFDARFEQGAPLGLPTHTYRAFLAYLALSPGRAHPREKLVALLWSTLSRAQGRTRLRQAILALRRALGRSASATLAIGADSIALRPEAVTVDAVEFQRLAGAEHGEALTRAAELYTGDLLAGVPVRAAPFEEWLAAERARLGELAIQVLTRLLVMRRDAGALDGAVQVAHRLLALDPLQEPAHRTLMDLYRRLGRRADALRQYQVCLDALARELGAEPGPETRRLYVDVLREGAAPIPPDAAAGHATAWITTAGAGPLVGREAERQRLRRALDSVFERAGSVVVITGEAGMGKTRLVGDVAAGAVGHGARVLVGQCHETDQILAFGPWAEALQQVEPARVIEIADGLGPAKRGELARLLPRLAHGAASASSEPLPLFEAVADLLRGLCTAEPVVLILEDLHWADEMSVRLLAFVARRILGASLLILATARAEEMADVPFVRRALDTLASAQECIRIELTPLSRDDTTRLVHALASTDVSTDVPQLARSVWALSEGHPFTIVEMLRTMHHEGAAASRQTTDLPRRVRQAVALRLERLGERARRLVDVAAVIGRQFDVELLALAAGVDADTVVEGIEELVRRRVVESVGDGFRFVHHRVLEVARPALLPRRALLHRRVAEALETRYAADVEPHLGALADHYQRAGVWDRAAMYLQRAGDLARRRGAYREAIVSYETALGAVSHLPRSPATLEQEVALRLGMRYALSPLGEMTRVIACVEPVRQMTEAIADRRRLALAETCLSEAWRWLGDYGRAAEASRRGHALAAEIEDRDVALLGAVFLGSTYLAQGRHTEARPLLEEAVVAMRDDDSRATLVSRPANAAAACGWLARSLAMSGDRARVPALLDEAIRHAEAVGSPHALAVACSIVGEVRLLVDPPAAALAVLERGLELCRRAEIEHRLAMLEAATGYAYALVGRLAEGRQLLETAIARADGQRQLWFQAQRLAWLADVYRRAGKRADAAQTAARALELARRIGERDSELLALRAQSAAGSLTSARSSRALPTARGPSATARRKRPRRAG